jgi:Domain of unknown function (DUF4380)
MFIDIALEQIIEIRNNPSFVSCACIVIGASKLKITTVLLIVAAIFCSGYAKTDEFKLKSRDLEVLITPNAGRILALSRNGQENLIKTGVPIKDNVITPVDANTGFVPHLGHEVWFGPQSEWWSHQNLNTKRRDMKAAWPPDPFSVLAKNQIIFQSADKIVMKSGVSPVTGLEVEKTFSLVADDPRQLDLIVKAINRRETEVSWDIWFNTRSFPQTRIYAPVDETTNVRSMTWESPDSVKVEYEIVQNLLSLKLEKPPKGKSKLMGKILFQPTQGWFAAFYKKQLLIVQFPHVPIEKIHPEQGQLEFYLEHSPRNDSLEVLEMEVHAAYKKLKPGEEMQARERWTLIEYSGDESADAQREFLRAQLKGLKEI